MTQARLEMAKVPYTPMVSGGLLVPVEYYQGLLTFCLSIVIADPVFWTPLFYCIITRIQYISSLRLLIRTVVLYGTTLLLTAQLTFFCTLAHYKSCFLLTSPKYTHLLSTLIFFKTSTTNI